MFISPLTYQSSSKFNQNQMKQSFRNPAIRMMSDTVSFQSAAKSICNPLDSAFIKVLAKDLQLDDKQKEKLKNIVWKYLRENRLESLGDLSGEDYLDAQVELSERITKGLNIKDEYLEEYISTEVIKRCEDAENYIPYGIKEFEKEMKYEQQFANSFKTGSVAKSFSRMVEKSIDDKMCSHICRVLRLTPEESTEFRNTISDFLEENDMNSLADFVKMNEHESNIYPSNIILLLEDKFNLDAFELMSVTSELFTRLYNAKSHNYKPITPIHMKDFLVLKNIMNKGDYDYELSNPVDSEKDFGFGRAFVAELYSAMDAEATQKGYQNIFEIFNPENVPMLSKSWQVIQNSQLSDNQKSDLVLDLIKTSDDSEDFYSNVPNFKFSSSFKAIANSVYMSKKLITKYDIPEMFLEKIVMELLKINSKSVIGGQNCSVEKIAYELADKYGLPVGTEKEIINMLKELNKSYPDADTF